MRVAIFLIAALALVACAESAPNAARPAMAADECAFTNWREAGWQDGAAGLTQAAFDERVTICRAAGVTPDETAYFQGRVEGLQAYCAPTNGYRLGGEGAGHTNICPPGLREAFLAEYERGRADQAQAGGGSWSPSVGFGARVGVGSSGWRGSGVGISIGL